MHTIFQNINPLLPSTDVARDIAWYIDKLGFHKVFSYTDPETKQVDYAGLGRQNLYFGKTRPGAPMNSACTT